MLAVHRDAVVRSSARKAATPYPVTTMRRSFWEYALRVAGGRASLLRVIDARHIQVLDARYSPPR